VRQKYSFIPLTVCRVEKESERTQMAYEMFPARRRRLCFNKNINNVNTQPMVNWPARLEMGINMDMGSSFWLPQALTEFMQKYVFFPLRCPFFPQQSIKNQVTF